MAQSCALEPPVKRVQPQDRALPARITIDGTVYTSASVPASPVMGVAITTHNRSDIARRCVEQVIANSKGAHVVVVDDASDKPFTAEGVTVFRFDAQQGIARSKNKCIELLMDAGVEHLFLLDDDCWPIDQTWMERYANHPEPHLCYLFKDRNGRGQVMDTPRTTYDDGTMWAQEHPRGCLLYLHRSVVERVGGYRREFGIWGNEHIEYSQRIFNAGLTLQPYQDICGAEKIVCSLDANPAQHEGFKRSVPERVRSEELARNDAVLERFAGTDDFVEYRDLPNRVVTAFFTSHIDPQRGRQCPADPALVEPWRTSITGAETVILHDSLDEAPGRVHMPSGMIAYVQRWCAYYQYLRDHPSRWVFCTDGFDVTMLREPWEQMRPGVLYVGYEPAIVGIPWMIDRHPEHRQWIIDNADRTLLNCGVIGGDHATVMRFCRDMAHLCLSSRAVFDMGSFNKLAYSPQWADRIVTGPKVTTLFKHNQTARDNDFSWWSHK